MGTRNRRGPEPGPGGSVVLEPEADLETDLEVLDRAVLDLAADVGHLEPVDVPQGLRGTGDRVVDRVLVSLGRRPDDLGDAVGAVRHLLSWVIQDLRTVRRSGWSM